MTVSLISVLFILKHKLTYFKLLMKVKICCLKRVTEAQTVRTACLADDLKPLLKV